MGTTNVTTNVTTVEDIYSVHKRQLCFSKEAILRVDETEASEQNGTFCSFPPLDRVQPSDCWEATVRSSPGANSREADQQRGWRWLQVGIKQQRASVHRGSRGFQLGLQ